MTREQLMATERKALSRRMSLDPWVKTLMHSSGRWWPWAISRARGLPRQTRSLHSPTRELASGNTVSPSEGFRRSSASCILPPQSQRLPSTPDPAGLIALSYERALVPCGESGEGLQQRRGVVGQGEFSHKAALQDSWRGRAATVA